MRNLAPCYNKHPRLVGGTTFSVHASKLAAAASRERLPRVAWGDSEAATVKARTGSMLDRASHRDNLLAYIDTGATLLLLLQSQAAIYHSI